MYTTIEVAISLKDTRGPCRVARIWKFSNYSVLRDFCLVRKTEYFFGIILHSTLYFLHPT